jgi:hypothetical protein
MTSAPGTSAGLPGPADGQARKRGLAPREREVEDAVRLAGCPVCGVPRGARCDDGPRRDAVATHTGRYRAAVAAGLVVPLVGGEAS